MLYFHFAPLQKPRGFIVFFSIKLFLKVFFLKPLTMTVRGKKYVFLLDQKGTLGGEKYQPYQNLTIDEELFIVF